MDNGRDGRIEMGELGKLRWVRRFRTRRTRKMEWPGRRLKILASLVCRGHEN
jgi:hypothetical protein